MAFLVYLTLPVEMDPVEFSENLVRGGLAAGMNILGQGTSVFRWNNEIQTRKEWYIVAQVKREVFEAFTQKVREIHPYDTPCITALPIEKGYAPFMKWIDDMCGTEE